MPKSDRCLLQVRITPSQKGRIKSLAARQHITIEKAVIEAFDAWAEKLRTGGPSHAKRQGPSPPPTPASEPVPQAPSLVWLARSLKADWAQCPEAELVSDGTNRMWLLRGTDAPLNEVMAAIDDGIPLPEIAGIFELDPAQLAKVIEFAAALPEPDAIN